ncbi:MAG: hypothetical protein ACE5JO_14425 [Candidatus Binatia bacterium]
MSKKGVVILILAAVIVIHVSAFLLMVEGVELVSTYFYLLAWWTYIVFLSCINHLGGQNSLLLDNPREFLWVFFYSTPVWLFFEIHNFWLDNWSYTGIPSEAYVRWPGYVLAFGTVLPGIFETENFLRSFGVFTQLRGRPVKVTQWLLVRFLIVGSLMMLLVPLRPDLFFPLLWLGWIFLLDPLIYRKDRQRASLLGQAQRGEYSLLVRLLVTGMMCGLLWEFWNYWASAKWVYTVPYLGFVKIFEMPVLGFFGFPPFALECYLLYRAFLLFRERFLRAQRWIPAVTAALVILYCLLVFTGIDRWTVAGYKAILS